MPIPVADAVTFAPPPGVDEEFFDTVADDSPDNAPGLASLWIDLGGGD